MAEVLDTRPYCPELASRDEYFLPQLQSLLYRTMAGELGVDAPEEEIHLLTVALTGGGYELWCVFGPPDEMSVSESWSWYTADEALWAHVALAELLTPHVPPVKPSREMLLATGQLLRTVRHGR